MTYFFADTEQEAAAYCGYSKLEDFRTFYSSYHVLEPMIFVIKDIVLDDKRCSYMKWSRSFHQDLLIVAERIQRWDKYNLEKAFGSDVNLDEAWPLSDKKSRGFNRKSRLLAWIFRLKQSLERQETSSQAEQQRRQDTAVAAFKKLIDCPRFPKIDVTKIVRPSLGPYTEDGENELDAWMRLFFIFRELKHRCSPSKHITGFLNNQFLKSQSVVALGPQFMASDSYKARKVSYLSQKLNEQTRGSLFVDEASDFEGDLPLSSNSQSQCTSSPEQKKPENTLGIRQMAKESEVKPAKDAATVRSNKTTPEGIPNDSADGHAKDNENRLSNSNESSSTKSTSISISPPRKFSPSSDTESVKKDSSDQASSTGQADESSSTDRRLPDSEMQPPFKKRRLNQSPADASTSGERSETTSGDAVQRREYLTEQQVQHPLGETRSSESVLKTEDMEDVQIDEIPNPVIDEEHHSFLLHWVVEDSDAEEILKKLKAMRWLEVKQESVFDLLKLRSASELQLAIEIQYGLSNIKGQSFTIEGLMISCIDNFGDRIRRDVLKRDWQTVILPLLQNDHAAVIEFYTDP